MSSYSFKVQKVSLDEVGLKLLNMRQNKSFVWDIVFQLYDFCTVHFSMTKY